MSDLKIIRLVTGEELIGFVEEYTSEEIGSFVQDETLVDEEFLEQEPPNYSYDHLLFVRDPLKVMCQYNVQTKKYSMFLIRWTAASDDTFFAIPKNLVITICQPIPELVEHYNEVKNEEINILKNTPPDESDSNLEKQNFESQKLKDFLESFEFDEDDDKKH